jgi:hypothetical protein
MNWSPEQSLRAVTRRHFFHDCALGLGSLALASLLDNRAASAAAATDPLAAKPGHSIINRSWFR